MSLPLSDAGHLAGEKNIAVQVAEIIRLRLPI
jgi:hypothetical protein